MKSESKSSIAGSILILGVLAVVGIVITYVVMRYLFPAFTMSFVHLVSLPAFFFMWAVGYTIVAAVAFQAKGFLRGVLLTIVLLFGITHSFVAYGLGDYALHQEYAIKGERVNNLPIPSLDSAKFLPANVAEARLKAAGNNSQLKLAEIDEAIVITSEGESHIGYAATLRPNDFETKISGVTEIVYIDAHTGKMKVKKEKLAILPGGTLGQDPSHAFYASLPFWDLTSHNAFLRHEEIIPIIDEKNNRLLFAMPVISPKTVLVGAFPLSNIPKYTGAVVIDPVSGVSNLLSVAEIQKDPVLSRARLFPIELAKQVASASRFEGVNGIWNMLRAILPSNISSYANYELAPDPEKAGQWPALYSSSDKKPYLYYPYLPNSSSRALIREVSIDADTGSVYVKNVNAIASPKWIVDSVLTQKLAAENLLQSSFGQFDEPTPLEINGQRHYVFPITSSQGSQVIAFAVTDTTIDTTTGQVQTQFFKTPQEIVDWAKNPAFMPQSLREVFLGQATPSAKAQQSSGTNNNSQLEQKIDNLANQMKALTEAVKALSK